MSKKHKHKNKKHKDRHEDVKVPEEQTEAAPEPGLEPELPEIKRPDADPAAAEAQPESDTETVNEPQLTEEERIALELAEARDQVLRARADFDNYRKRMAREMERVRKVAAEALIHDILPGIDNLGLAIMHADENPEALKQGVAMVHKQLQDALGNHGLKPIEAAGKPFDPNVHEAVQQVASNEVEKDHVVQVFQSGYMLGDMILRPAKVVVSTGKPDSTQDTTEENTAESSASAE